MVNGLLFFLVSKVPNIVVRHDTTPRSARLYSHPLAQMAEGLYITSPTALQVRVTSAGAVKQC